MPAPERALGAPCPHGNQFVTLCPHCTPPSEKEEEHQCDKMMLLLGWRAVRISQPRHTMQTEGISDRRYYPPADNPRGFKPFWFEVKRRGGKQRPDQLAFQRMVEEAGEIYVLGGLQELSDYCHQTGIAKFRLIG